VHALLSYGHTLASHSVGHFPDFDNEVNFPLGNAGNTPPQYQPFYTGGISTGGTVMGEVEVSKNLIEDDHSVNVRSFRAGHLCYNDSLALGLMAQNYEFNSTHSANNVLTSFPYYDLNLRSFSGVESTILEIPMTISDVFSSDPITSANYPQKVNLWKNVARKYHNNHSSVVLLIHPNRMYKLTAQQMILDSLPEGMEVINMEKYGDFWRKRDSLKFHTYITGDTLFVKIDNDKLDTEQSFVIDMNGLDTAKFINYDGSALYYAWDTMENGRRLYYRTTGPDAISENEINNLQFQVYPNPTNGNVALVTTDFLMSGRIDIINSQGRLVYTQNWNAGNRMLLNLENMNLQNGIYILRYISNERIITARVVYNRL
jgi:hypothetical protein